jgi:hemoglobin
MITGPPPKFHGSWDILPLATDQLVGHTHNRHEVAIRSHQHRDTHMTIYDTIGGETTVGAVVDELYRRTLDDLHLKGYFDSTDMDLLHRYQRAFIAAALGKPGTYQGRAMGEAHAGMNITDDAFDRVATPGRHTARKRRG